MEDLLQGGLLQETRGRRCTALVVRGLRVRAKRVVNEIQGLKLLPLRSRIRPYISSLTGDRYSSFVLPQIPRAELQSLSQVLPFNMLLSCSVKISDLPFDPPNRVDMLQLHVCESIHGLSYVALPVYSHSSRFQFRCLLFIASERAP